MLVLSTLPAAAQFQPRDGARVSAQQGSQQRDSARREGRRQQQPDRRQGERERRDALTADERRELNRDLERANREIYRKGRDNR